MTSDRPDYVPGENRIEPHTLTIDALGDELRGDRARAPHRYELLSDLSRAALGEIVDTINDRITTAAERPSEWEPASHCPGIDCDDDTMIYTANVVAWVRDIEDVLESELDASLDDSTLNTLAFVVADDAFRVATRASAFGILTGDEIAEPAIRWRRQ